EYLIEFSCPGNNSTTELSMFVIHNHTLLKLNCGYTGCGFIHVHTDNFEFFLLKFCYFQIYPVSEKSISSRVALLITNRNFADKNLTRKGAEVDEENMEKLLKYLQYDVVKYNDLTGKSVLQTSQTHRDRQCVCGDYAHGMLGIVLGVNHREDKPDEFPVDKICKHLDSKGCPALLNKPKIIIIQACRGGPVHGDGIVEDALRSVHKEKDFVYFMSSTPDTKSYRHTKQGSLLIQFIYEVFNTCSKKDDIDELFRKVMRRFENYRSQDALRQMPSKDRETLIKRFYLFPSQRM
uniref:Caspase family p20 domain-containing protein n=1 Tax=Amphilophus citrinellus TaxID=61819 RepID=A0A3Q0S838_AMPCI